MYMYNNIIITHIYGIIENILSLSTILYPFCSSYNKNGFYVNVILYKFHHKIHHSHNLMYLICNAINVFHIWMRYVEN